MAQSKTQNTRGRLLDAAQKRLLYGNAGDVTLRKVAKDAGVSPAAVYRHFPGKEALIEEITMAAIERFEHSLWREIASLPVGSIERLVRLGEAYIRFAASNPGDFDALFTPSKAGPRPLDRFSGGVGYDLLKQCVGEAMESGALKRADPALVSLLLWTRVHGIVQLLRTVNFAGEVAVAKGAEGPRKVFAATSAMIFDGLSKKATK